MYNEVALQITGKNLSDNAEDLNFKILYDVIINLENPQISRFSGKLIKLFLAF